MLVGAPGLLLALVVLFVMREPRHSRPVEAAAAPARLSTGDAMREIFASRAFVYILIASSVVAFLGDRKSVVSGKRVSVRVDFGGRRIIHNNKSDPIDVTHTTQLIMLSKNT